MMIRMATTMLACGLLALVGCGGDDGEALVSGSLTGEYEGHAFTPGYGFATLYRDSGLIALGDGDIHCGSESDSEPPKGTNAIFSVPLEAGIHSGVSVELIQNISDYHAVGTNTGTVTITTVTDQTVAGSVAFDYTDTEARHFAVNGDFEVLHCAP